MLLFIGGCFTVEDIADNVGLKAAFHAFTNWMSYRDENLRTHRLPALDLTPQQMFFVGFAQVLPNRDYI